MREETAEDLKQTARQALYDWQYRDQSSFYSRLYDLIAKADTINKFRLEMGFPEFVQVYDEWFNFPTSQHYFLKYGVVA